MSAGNPPTSHSPPARRRVSSNVIVNTRNSKGKSTAAFGRLTRGIARGWDCGVVQFTTSGQWRTGEGKVCSQLGIDWWTCGDGFSWASEELAQSAAVARAAWAAAADMLTGSLDRLVPAEISYPI